MQMLSRILPRMLGIGGTPKKPRKAKSYKPNGSKERARRLRQMHRQKFGKDMGISSIRA